MATTVRASIARSEDIIDKLLLLAESERPVDREPVDLAAVVEQSIAQHSAASQARDLAFAASLGVARVHGDRALLERLVDNLIDNAVKYATKGSIVAASVAAAPQTVTVRIANAGEEIDPDELPHLFERFSRRGTSRSRREGGSGPGMAIVAVVAETHGGSVSAEGPPASGLVVTVSLPRQTSDSPGTAYC